MKQILFLLSFIVISLKCKAQASFACLNQTNIVTTFTAQTLVHSIFPGDFNNDGKTDVIYSYNGNLWPLLAVAGGSYTAGTITPVYSSVQYMTGADYNKDGNLDLALTYGPARIDVLLGNGNGTFNAAQMYYPTYQLNSMISADINNDSHVDIIAALTSGSVQVMYGSSTGSFVSVSNTYVGGVTEIISEDFNNDGRKDIAGITNPFSNIISVLLAQANGSLSAPVNYTVGIYPMSLSSSDFNNDGIKDIVTSNRDSDDISVLLGVSTGSFLPPVHYNVGSDATLMKVVSNDFNNDLNQDIVAMDYSTGNIFVFFGSGTGTFNTKSSISLNGPISMLSSDMNNDGKPDLLFRYSTSYEFSILYGSNSKFNLPYSLLYAMGNVTDMLAIDYDLDSNLDLAMLSSNKISLLKGNGSGGFTPASSYTTDIGSQNIISADLNRDGFSDFAVANASAGNVSVLFGNNAGTFSQAVNYSAGGSGPNSIAAGDFNSDSIPDIAVANYASSNIRYLLGNSSGTYALSPNINWWAGVNPLSLMSKDLNNDGKMDLFFAGDNNSTADIGILFGNGSVGFSLSSMNNTGAYTKSVLSEDFDHNGTEDIAAATAVKLTILNTPYSVASGQIKAVDLNHDGNLDIVSAGAAIDNLIVLFGNGVGGFTNITRLWGGNYPNRFVTGDFNNDGSHDLIANNYGSSSITVLLNSVPDLTITGADSLCRGNSANLLVTGASTYSWSTGSLSNMATVSPTINTTYTVTGTNQLGCSNIKKKYIKVNVLPLPTVSANTGTICEGESFTIIPSGASTYSYSGGTSIISPTVTSSYTITGFASNGCYDTIIKTIIVNAAPTLTVNSGAVCIGGSFTITPSGADSYTITGGTDIVTPTSDMSYSVTGTDNKGCISITPAISDVTVNALPVITANSGSVCSGQTFTIMANGATTYTYSGGTDVVSPLADMSYSVTGTDSNGCVSSMPAVSHVAVNTLPVITANDGVICSGQSFTIIPGGALSYTYSGGSDIVSPSSSMSYSITGTDSNGCKSLAPAVSHVTVNALPMITASGSNTLLCTGETVTLTAAGATSYTWNTSENTSVIVVSPTVNTVYSVSTIDTNNCSNTALVTLSVSTCTDIKLEKADDFETAIFPNPTNGVLNISFSSIPQNTKIEMYNSIGALMLSETMSGKINTIITTGLSSGIYFMKVLENDKVVVVKKVVKE